MNEQYYAILGLDKNIQYTDEEIKTAYHKMAMKYHPDRNKDAGAADKFKEIKKAYDVLSNQAKFNLFSVRENYHYDYFYNQIDYQYFVINQDEKLEILLAQIEFLKKVIKILEE